MSQASFQVTYDGPALENHEFDVRELAPALLALGELFEEANFELNGGRAKVQLNVKGSFQSGSFGIDLTLVQNLVSQTVSIFSGTDITAALNIINALGIAKYSGKGLIGVVKKLRNRPIKNVVIFDDGKVKIEVDDDLIETEEDVIKLLRNLRVRNALERVISKPLNNPGVDTFSTKYEDEVVEVSGEESEYFEAPKTGDELLSDDEVEASLQALSVVFTEGNKWRFTDGNAVFYAAVHDENFIKQVQLNQLSFAKDDLIKVKMRRRQKLTNAGIKTEYDILEVLEHRSAARQLELPISESHQLEGDQGQNELGSGDDQT